MSNNFRPLQDAIDKRDWHHKMHNSIVKGYNVRYRTAEEVRNDEDTKQVEQASEIDKANEIYMRLQEEAERDRRASEEEWTEKIRRENHYFSGSTVEGYNPTTKAFSGMYGQGEVSPEAKSVAESILQEKDSNLLTEDLIKELQGGD